MTETKRTGFWPRLGEIAKSYLTAPDGESYAPGRLMGFILFGLIIWLIVFMVLNVAAGPHTVQDWVIMMGQLMIFVPAMAATCVGLVLGIAPTDTGGKWWSKDASPPPPPTTDGKPT